MHVSRFPGSWHQLQQGGVQCSAGLGCCRVLVVIEKVMCMSVGSQALGISSSKVGFSAGLGCCRVWLNEEVMCISCGAEEQFVTYVLSQGTDLYSRKRYSRACQQ